MKNRIFSLLVTVILCGITLNAQQLKSSPQGNENLKLNGTFEIPTDANLAKSTAISMILSDLNGDGINELITGRENGISIQMGDINAFAPQTQEAWEAIRDLRFISPFRQESQSIELPIRAEIILSGDFNRDGRMDIAAAARGGNSIYLIEGNGIGGFGSVREIPLAGRITSLISGDVNRLDGLPDIIAGLDNNGIFSLSIYQGLGDIFNTEPEILNLTSPATQILGGQFDESSFADIAVVSGGEVVIFSGHEKDSQQVEPLKLSQGFEIKGIAAGDFIPDRDYRSELALLSSDGYIRILSRGDLDTRPVTKQELLGVEAYGMQKQGMIIPQRILKQISQSDLREKPESNSSDAANWSESDSFYGAANGEALSGGVLLSSARLSNRAGDDLILMDQANKSLQVMPLIVNEDGEKGVEMSYVGKRVPVRFDLDGTPIAITAERLNFDGSKDLIILEAGKTTPTTLMSAPEAAFTVNSNGDAPDASPGNGVCATSGAVCTLRAAIMESNRLGGADSITINSGIGTIALSTGFPDDDSLGTNDHSTGDLDISCTLTAGQDCALPLNTNVSGLTITGAAGGSVVAGGTFAVDPNGAAGTNSDRIFDVGMDGIFGGGFGGSVQINVTMSNLTIQSGNVRQNFNMGTGSGNFARGGAFRYDGFGQAGTRGTLSLTSVTIQNNQADHNTGGIFNQFASVSISSSTVSGNIGKAGPGGGLQFAASTPATLTVSGSTFSTNEARTGPIFSSTAIDVDGGGIYATMDSNTASITTTNFTSNISHDDGGGLYVASGATTVSGGTMSGNTARDDGGFAAGDNDTVSAARFMTLSSVTIRSNTANSDASGGGDGGGVFRDRGTLNVSNCFIGTVALPNAAVNGGGIAHAFRAAVNPTNVTTINVDNGSIVGNNATTTGGGTFIDSTNNVAGDPSDLNIGATTSVLLSENNANLHGGGVAVLGGANANLTRAFIHGNDADKDNNASGDGGGVYTANGTVVIPATSSIGTAGQGNTAENGGAIHHSAGTLTITGVPISSNTTDVHGGALSVSGGTVNVNGVTFVANTSTSGTEVRLTGGTTNFIGTVTIPGELSIAGGTLVAGSSTVNLGEDFHFSSGTFTAGTSTFNFNGTAAQQIYGGAVPTFNNLTDANTTQPLNVQNNANANGTLDVNANAVLNPAAASVIGGTGTLTGSGTARVTRTAATADFSSQYTIANKTLTNLLVDYVGASAQTISALTYGNLRLNNASGGSLAIGTTTVNGTLTLTNGVFAVGTNTLVINNGITAVSGLTSSATGTVNYNQGSNGQAVIIANYGNLTFSNFNKTLPSGTVGIAGTFTPGSAVGHTITGNTISFNGAGVQTIPAFTYNNLTTATGGVKTTSGAVNASGNATVSAGTTLVVASGSTFSVVGTLTNNSTIQGLGTIANNFSNGGILAPGLSPGILNITGNFANTGSVNIEIGGTGGAGVNPNGHDQLLISGTATIGGTLNVTLTNAFTPAPGNTFTILDAASSTGTFATTNLPNILPNIWNVAYSNANGTVILTIVAPVAAAVPISGRVATQNGTGIAKARVSLTNSSGITRTVLTNAFGYYQFEDVEVGGSYTVQVVSKRYTFAPRVIEVFDEISGLDFTAEP